MTRTLVALFAMTCGSLVMAAHADNSATDQYVPTPLVSVSLGYSFGLATTPLSTDANSKDSDNEPLVALRAENIGRPHVKCDVLLALANFGRLAATVEPAAPAAESTAAVADVRRAVLGDLTIRFGTYGLAAAVNLGIVFDAQHDDTAASLDDARSYFFVGPSFATRFGTDVDAPSVRCELMFGESEIMTGKELFSTPLDKSQTIRVRPRLEFHLGSFTSSTKPVTIGFWGDLGFAEDVGDTYAVFLSTALWSKQ